MVDPIKTSAQIAGLWGRLGGSSRLCYRGLVERIAPTTEDALDLLRHRRLFVITSTGRSGTMWLADLLNRIDGAYVVHEPIPEEGYDHAEAFAHPEEAAPYLRNFRLRDMALRIRQLQPAVYGEVNGLLRRHMQALRDLLPNTRTIQLVRDGRDFVTSVMNRQTYSPQDKIYGSFQPPADVMDPAEWLSMDRFSRICWMWAQENAHIRKYTDSFARFEEITTRYDLFKEQILSPLDLDLDEGVWTRHTKNRVNATQVRQHASYDGWTADQKDAFWPLCEAEMAVYGYRR